MGTVSFEQISFHDRGEQIRGVFLKRYYFDIPRESLEEVAPVTVQEGGLVFAGIGDGYASKRFDPILDKAFDRLYHINYNKPTIYIHRNSVPLIGTNEFGIVDRGSNIIEVKPLTGCNLSCPYCSVDEGRNDKTHDYIVECDYLVDEAARVAKIKRHRVEFHIGPQGEPLLYPEFTKLVRGLKAIPNCKLVTVVTNGTLLSRPVIDELAVAGLDKINLSLNALSQETADRMAGRRYPVEHVVNMVRYAQGKINIILAPTIVPGWNETEIEPLIQLGKGLRSDFPVMGIQNFLSYPRGRNPVKPRPFEEFNRLLRPYEEKHGMRLTKFTKEDYHIHDDEELEKPFRKHDIVKATIAIPSRYPREVIAVAKGRCITVKGGGLARGRRITVRIIRDKHNIYKGVPV